MTTASIVERPTIQDTLFGEAKVVDPQAQKGPDGGCFCICACRAASVKIPNSNNVAVDDAITL